MYQPFQSIINYFARQAAPVTDRIKKALMTWRMTRSHLWKVKAEFDNYRAALDQAQSPVRPDRRYLYGFYRECELDDTVITQRRVATMTVQRAPFEVMRNGKHDEAATDLLQRPWFYDLLEVATVTEFWGHSIVEFNPLKSEDGEFGSFWVVPRDQVRPEYGDVLMQQGAADGVPFRDPKAFPFLVEMGRPDDLGLYHVVCIPVLRKRFADTDWSLFSERFGSPFLTIKTQSRDAKELDAKEAMARNFGSNGYAILDDQDEINTVIGNYTGTAHYTFRDRINLADEQIAKLINGQTGTSDEKAWAGSAQVHERLLNDFTFARLTRIQYFINFQLIPFLVSHGYDLEGAKLEFTELRKRDEKAVAGDAPAEPPKPGRKQLDVEKKSPGMNTLGMYYSEYFHLEDCNCPSCQTQ